MNSPEKTSRRDFLFKVIPSMAGPALLAACGGGESTPSTIGNPEIKPPGTGDSVVTATPTPEATKIPDTREGKLLSFANSVLKKGLTLDQIRPLVHVDPDKNTQKGYAEYTSKIPGDTATIYLSRTENPDGTKLREQSVQVERRDQKDRSLDIVLSLFNDFLKMPPTASNRDAWTITPVRPDLITYELPVQDDPEGPAGKSFTTRSAYVLTQRTGDYAVVVGSANITENSPEHFKLRSGLVV